MFTESNQLVIVHKFYSSARKRPESRHSAVGRGGPINLGQVEVADADDVAVGGLQGLFLVPLMFSVCLRAQLRR